MFKPVFNSQPFQDLAGFLAPMKHDEFFSLERHDQPSPGRDKIELIPETEHLP